MAHSLSAKKRVRQNASRKARNRWRKNQIKEVVKTFDDAITAGNIAKATEQLNICYKVLDKIAAKGTIHKNTVARRKATLARKLHKISTR